MWFPVGQDAFLPAVPAHIGIDVNATFAPLLTATRAALAAAGGRRTFSLCFTFRPPMCEITASGCPAAAGFNAAVNSGTADWDFDAADGYYGALMRALDRLFDQHARARCKSARVRARSTGVGSVAVQFQCSSANALPDHAADGEWAHACKLLDT
jgi:hypothetical protein